MLRGQGASISSTEPAPPPPPTAPPPPPPPENRDGPRVGRTIAAVFLLLGVAVFALPGASLSSYGIGRFIGGMLFPILLAAGVRWVYLRSVKNSDARVWGRLSNSVPLLATAVLIAAATAIPQAVQEASERAELAAAEPADPNSVLSDIEGYELTMFPPDEEVLIRREVLTNPEAAEEIASVEIREFASGARPAGFVLVIAVEPEVFAAPNFEDNFLRGLQSGFGGEPLEPIDIDGHDAHAGTYSGLNVTSFFLDEGLAVMVTAVDEAVGRDFAGLIIAEHG